jgi:pyruvate formate lyase activating enzyme
MGIVYDIQRFCVHDGPGIRTAIFLKGCNLRCRWCHNPESFELAPQILRFKSSGLWRIAGQEMTASEVVDVILRDAAYYAKTGGGVTFTGGEPTYQYDFLHELLILCKTEKINICVETNACLPRERLFPLLEYIDLLLVDFKHYDSSKHKLLTGEGNESIIENIKYLNTLNFPFVLRLPLVPGLNDSEEHLATAHALSSHVEILPYHNMGTDKEVLPIENICGMKENSGAFGP